MVAVLTVSLMAVGAVPAEAATVPSGFTDTLVAAVASPTAVAATPDGRILVASRPGRLMVVKNGVLLGAPAIDLSTKICANQERGLLGIAVDPNPSTNSIYLFYTAKGTAANCPYGTPEPAGPPRNRVSKLA